MSPRNDRSRKITSAGSIKGALARANQDNLHSRFTLNMETQAARFLPYFLESVITLQTLEKYAFFPLFLSLSFRNEFRNTLHKNPLLITRWVEIRRK